MSHTTYTYIQVTPHGKDSLTIPNLTEDRMRELVSKFKNRDPEALAGWSIRVEKFEKTEVLFF